MCAFFVGDNMNYYMLEAIKEARKALEKGDVPIGAIIVYKDTIIAKAHNKKEQDNCATSHAEILAINKACRKLKTWHLEECTLYVTMEPCMMCSGAIIQSRISKVVYGIENKNFGAIKHLKKVDVVNIESNKCKELIKTFFKNKR